MTHSYLRYVALGDSQTEGMNDGDDIGGYRGWADRLAERLATVDPQVHYANLAVRGRRAHQVHAEQLPAALSLRPDLATVMAGVNDLLRSRFDAAATAGHLEAMFEALTGAGARVVTFGFPDPPALSAATRGLATRIHDLNARIRTAADRRGVTVVDLAAYPVCRDPRLWSTDRLHLNTLGHTRLAAAVGHALGLPDSDNPLDGSPRPAGEAPGMATRRGRPSLGRKFPRAVAPAADPRRSSGDGRTAKRPALAPVTPRPQHDQVP